IITRRVHAGLKQDSLMLNQNFNVAETMSRVIMAKLTTQVGNYQRSVGTVVSDVRLMALKLAGYSVESVYTEYESAMIGDKLRDEQAYAAKIKNRMQLRDMGIISQQDMAQEVGYEEPHAERNVDYTVPSLEKQAQGKQAVPKDPTNPATTVDPAQAQDPTASGATAYNATLLYHRIHRGADEFDYGDECTCGECDHVISYAKDKDKKKKPNIDDAIALYQSDVNYEYRQLIDRASLRIVSELEGIGNGVTAEQLTDKVFYILYSEWDATFNQAQQKHIKKWVRNIYDIFRRDSEGIFGTATDVKPSFDLFDIRALQYFEDSDNFYLGKFITDTDTRRAVTEFVKQAYLVDGTPIGKNPQAIENFKDGFRELMYLEDWKIRRIIDTSVNRMRNTGALSYMQQAGVTSFKRIGIRSANQCQYCAHMDGQVFSVQEAYTAVEKAMHGQPQAIKYDLPFVTSVYGGRDGVERFKQLAPAQIQASGIHIPPSHGHCRCVIVAVL
ncbi:MAG: hypothetical protein H6550_15845, partial [Chitinophagales bacterium]|nr:hypothetical protein [Chitinophagales bacterium]